MNRYALFFCALLLFACLAPAQEISGTVYDTTGARVVKAEVTLVGRDAALVGELTDAKGAFTFSPKGAPPFYLSVRAQGFATCERELRDNVSNLEVILHPASAV